MKNFACFLALITYNSYATNTNTYEIKLCVIPLRDIVLPIVLPFVDNFEHMFVRGADNTGLNFEPEDFLSIFGGKAKIGRQNYPDASCKAIFTTNNPNEYNTKWQEFVDAYENAARSYKYNVTLKNCEDVTREIIKKLGYKI